MSGSIHSEFWLNDKNYCIDDYVKLHSIRKAVANFASIITGKEIDVKFYDGGDTFTDGKTITIGGEITADNIDSSVGLAIHEAGHIKYSNINALKLAWKKVPEDTYELSKGIDKVTVSNFVSTVCNYVDDMYIDAKTYHLCPGYREYITALHNDIYYNESVINALESSEFRDCSIDAYLLRIINIHSRHADLEALPGLHEIKSIIGLDTLHMKELSQQDRFEIAHKVSNVALKNIINLLEETKMNGDSDKKSGDGEHEDAEQKETVASETNSSEKQETNNRPEQKETQSNSKNVLDKQMDFILGKVNKSILSTEVKEKLETIAKSNVEQIQVGGDGTIPSVDAIFVQKTSKQFCNSYEFPYFRPRSSSNEDAYEGYNLGLQLGRELGSRLICARQENASLEIRQKYGKLHSRYACKVAVDDFNIFRNYINEENQPINIIISVDASHSMRNKWKETIKTVVAICYATSLIKEIHTQLMFRSGVDGRVYTAVIYNSEVDTIQDLKDKITIMCPNGSTPDGLAYQSIYGELTKCINNCYETLFITICDGMPYFSKNESEKYIGKSAMEHTRTVFEEITKKGITTIAFYIEDSDIDEDASKSNREDFMYMYGKSANIIDLDNVISIANIINKKLETELSKNVDF